MSDFQPLFLVPLFLLAIASVATDRHEIKIQNDPDRSGATDPVRSGVVVTTRARNLIVKGNIFYDLT